MLPVIMGMVIAVILIVTTIIFLCHYKRCPPDKILIKYGRTGHGVPAQIFHGGGTLILPILQSYSVMDLAPITIEDQHGQRLGVVQPGMESGIVQKAVERFMNVPNDEIRRAITALFQDLSSREEIEKALNNWGFELVSYSAD